jgi:hypothetical protein
MHLIGWEIHNIKMYSITKEIETKGYAFRSMKWPQQVDKSFLLYLFYCNPLNFKTITERGNLP